MNRYQHNARCLGFAFLCLLIVLFVKTACAIPGKLGWVDNPEGGICKGYFLDSFAGTDTLNFKHVPLHIHSEGAELTVHGISQLKGPITITQSSRKLLADRACLLTEDHQLKTVQLSGHVHYRQPGCWLDSDYLYWDLDKQSIYFGRSLFRISSSKQRWLWGTAVSGVRSMQGRLKLEDANLTTCPPEQTSWMIRASQVILNPKIGWGYAYHPRFYWHGVPLLYLPYVTFPLDKRRKTGLLFPTIGHLSDGGLHIVIPFYWNIAPNYDWLITPHFIKNRGIFLSNLFRYLTPHASGQAQFYFMFHDSLFQAFKADMSSQFALSQDIDKQQSLARLLNAHDYRLSFSIQHHLHWAPHWSFNADVNWVSDDYFYSDLPLKYNFGSPTYLLNQFTANFQDKFWKGVAQLQSYQTLHPINQNSVITPYQRLPHLHLAGELPLWKHRIYWQWMTEYDYFNRSSLFNTATETSIGSRWHIVTSLRIPYYGANGFIIPRITLDNAAYWLHNRLPGGGLDHINRLTPILDLDAGSSLERSIVYGKRTYLQTLEPRLFYLLIPKREREDVPLFDSYPLPLYLMNLFSLNHFSGPDRLTNTNRLTLSMTSRLFTQRSMYETLRASVGYLILFRPLNICTTSECKLMEEIAQNGAPLVGEINYSINPNWHANISAAFYDEHYHLQHLTGDLNYHPAKNRLLRLRYDFIRNGNEWVLSGNPNEPSHYNISYITLSLRFPMTERLHFTGDFNYNADQHYSEQMSYGLQYDTCCWSLRGMIARKFSSLGLVHEPQYRYSYYLQLQLKGLTRAFS